MTREPRGLGKGVRALLGEIPNADQLRKPVGYVNKEIVGTRGSQENTADILRIPVDMIEPNPFQPRSAFDEEALQELAASIRTLGLIQPVTVRRITDDWHTDFLTVGEGYYLGTTSGHKYFGAGEGFAVGDKLHAIVVDDSDFPEASHSLSVEERFERIIYMTHRHNIVSVWSDGREVVKR